MGVEQNPEHTFAVTLGYRGAAFSGYARQPGQLTVQGELEQALSVLYRRPVATACAGRTDSGVHARGQVASFDVSEQERMMRSDASLRRSLNALTHDDIVVFDVHEVPAGFSARFDAKAREYRYFFKTGDTPPLLTRDFCWYVPGELDVDAMQRASRFLIGEHDFKSFCRAESAVGKPTCREVMSVTFSHLNVLDEALVCMRVVGSSFLHSMVRTMAGTFAAVGTHRRDEEWVAHVLEARDRTAAGETAPAQGLVFWRVFYGDDVSLTNETDAVMF